MKRWTTGVVCAVTALLCVSAALGENNAAGFAVDVAGVVGRSDIVLERPNLLASEAMPLGNGQLGAAVWSADGLTVQMNRVDTMPYRLSPGQVVVPGLAALTGAKDYRGRLDLYNGAFEERGGGMTATVYVQPDTDTLVVDVTGADPKVEQTAYLKLWAPRRPRAEAKGVVGTLAESWVDDKDPGASGRRFGSLAAIGAVGRDVSVSVVDGLTVKVTVRPDAEGRFKIVAGAPHYAGSGDVAAMGAAVLAEVDADAHRVWWNRFWHRAGLIKITSPDGAGDYMENLRNLYLFGAAAESGGEVPGSQAGVGDLFSSVKDTHHWDPAAFWHWNLRMQVAANLGAGLPELNAPYFRLYRENLPRIEQWTREHMGGRVGVCVPETMRFNGQGIEYEAGAGWKEPVTGLNCDAGSEPYYNARTISTGAEVSLWVWQQYLATGDRAFLAENYPVMAAAARFLLSYEKVGADGLAHTQPSNAHETQWDTVDPTTDVAARRALYPAVMAAAKMLGRDGDLQEQLRAAVARIPELPRTQHEGKLSLLPASADADGQDVIAASYDPGAENHNYENIGLEPVWPYNLIGDESPLFDLARRTYRFRPYPTNQDWSFDPIQAARLGLGDEVGATLVRLTERYQTFVNGFANWGGSFGEFYVEQAGVVTTALQEALVQDYDGLIRIVPAIPTGWDFDGSVYVRGRTKVDVQVRNGRATAVEIEAGTAGRLRVRNPWLGEAVDVVEVGSGRMVRSSVTQRIVEFPVAAGGRYFLRRAGTVGSGFVPVSGSPSQRVKTLGKVQIGLQ